MELFRSILNSNVPWMDGGQREKERRDFSKARNSYHTGLPNRVKRQINYGRFKEERSASIYLDERAFILDYSDKGKLVQSNTTQSVLRVLQNGTDDELRYS